MQVMSVALGARAPTC